jgi:hypothetical protein
MEKTLAGGLFGGTSGDALSKYIDKSSFLNLDEKIPTMR